MDIEKIQVGPVSVGLLADSDRIVAHIRAGNKFEPASLAAWAEMCAPGATGTVLDIGGYSGLFAIAAAKLGCRVLAFEPMPKNAQRLRENAARNGVELKIYEAVVADMNGPTSITYNPNVIGMTAGASLVRKKGLQHPIQALTVDSLALDDLLAIKIDVERAEPRVLAGASATLERFRPRMLVEALGAAERSAAEAAAPGYRVESVLDVRNLLMVPC